MGCICERKEREAREAGNEGGGFGVKSQGDLNTTLRNMDLILKAPGSY